MSKDVSNITVGELTSRIDDIISDFEKLEIIRIGHGKQATKIIVTRKDQSELQAISPYCPSVAEYLSALLKVYWKSQKELQIEFILGAEGDSDNIQD